MTQEQLNSVFEEIERARRSVDLPEAAAEVAIDHGLDPDYVAVAHFGWLIEQHGATAR